MNLGTPLCARTSAADSINMLPLSLLKTAQGHPMLVELKNGDTYNGHLVNCDTWMNVNLREVICTSKDGDRFWKMPECYIRGNTIKYIRVPNEILDMVHEEDFSKRGTLCVFFGPALLIVKQTVGVGVGHVVVSVVEEVAVAGADVVAVVTMALVVVVDVAIARVNVDEVEVVAVDGVAPKTS
ncbi:hypothetical protein PsorP6_012685 [Peronosclerospora sorghi]|uniref:Uncharacterized protein n=1 Tax=Peronosclerospora sorghi TaxID=230839 RepID=A0ACC0WHL1_9STRA|nr:hypothetical protein PsorP6_012685 [Peronosclerospora sorghi]